MKEKKTVNDWRDTEQFRENCMGYPQNGMRLEDFFNGNVRSCIVKHPFMMDSKNVILGENCFINHGLTVLGFGDVNIGDNVGISINATIITIDHPRNPLLNIRNGGEWEDIDLSVTIKDGAFIGAGAIILGGITIGENAIVGAGSIVTKDVPANTTVAGNPAKPIKSKKNQLGEVKLPDYYTTPTLSRG